MAVLLYFPEDVEVDDVVVPILLIHLQQFIPSHQTQDGPQVVVLAVEGKGLPIGVVNIHDYSQRPYIDGRGDVVGQEQLFGGVVADGAPFVAEVDALVVKTGQVPVYQLSFVKFEIGADRVDHDVAHFYVVVDDPCPVGLVQRFEYLVEYQRSLVGVELQLPQDDAFLVGEDRQSAEIAFVGFAVVVSAILGPLDALSYLMHDVILPFELPGLFLEVPLDYFSHSGVFFLDEVHFS